MRGAVLSAFGSLVFAGCDPLPSDRPSQFSFDASRVFPDVPSIDLPPPPDAGPPPEIPPRIDAGTDAADADVLDVTPFDGNVDVPNDRGFSPELRDAGATPNDAPGDLGAARINVSGVVRLQDELPITIRTRIRPGSGWTVASLDEASRSVVTDTMGLFRLSGLPVAPDGTGATLLARPPGTRELGSIVTTTGEVPAFDTITLQSAVAISRAAVDTDSAHVVVLVDRRGLPVAGVTVEAPALAIRTHYDHDDFPGQLVQVTSVTGRLGTAVILNVAAPSSGTGIVRLRFGGTVPVSTTDLRVARRAVTWHNLSVR